MPELFIDCTDSVSHFAVYAFQRQILISVLIPKKTPSSEMLDICHVCRDGNIQVSPCACEHQTLNVIAVGIRLITRTLNICANSVGVYMKVLISWSHFSVLTQNWSESCKLAAHTVTVYEF